MAAERASAWTAWSRSLLMITRPGCEHICGWTAGNWICPNVASRPFNCVPQYVCTEIWPRHHTKRISMNLRRTLLILAIVGIMTSAGALSVIAGKLSIALAAPSTAHAAHAADVSDNKYPSRKACDSEGDYLTHFENIATFKCTELNEGDYNVWDLYFKFFSPASGKWYYYIGKEWYYYYNYPTEKACNGKGTMIYLSEDISTWKCRR